MPEPAVTVLLLARPQPLVGTACARLEPLAHPRVVLEAGTAEDALALAERHLHGGGRIDLVLMDINMRDVSGINGIDATARFRERHAGIAVLILSMHDKLEYVSQAMQAGARGYVLKDAPAADILVAIDTVTSGGICYSAALARQLARPQVQDNQLTVREQDVLRHLATGSRTRPLPGRSTCRCAPWKPIG